MYLFWPKNDTYPQNLGSALRILQDFAQRKWPRGA